MRTLGICRSVAHSGDTMPDRRPRAGIELFFAGAGRPPRLGAELTVVTQTKGCVTAAVTRVLDHVTNTLEYGTAIETEHSTRLIELRSGLQTDL